MTSCKQYFVYIMTNKSGTLYAGFTNSIKARVRQHREKTADGFTRKYNITRLLYFEVFQDVYAAIAREKAIKGWTRRKKLDLVATVNPRWEDLAAGWYDE